MTYVRENNYCTNADQNNATISDIDKFMFNNPAYTTHNINMIKYADFSLPTIPKIFQKRALSDITTDKFISTIFSEGTTLVDFSDLVYHTLNKYIMLYINTLLISENQQILDMNNEYVLVIFKGGNIMHLYYKFLQNIVTALNPEKYKETLDMYKNNAKYFKISDCDFNLYIISDSVHRYNLLYSYATPLAIRAIQDLQEFFEKKFNSEYQDSNQGKVLQPTGTPYTIEPNLQDCFEISDISKLDKLITKKHFLDMGLQNPLDQEYTENIELFKRVIAYSYNRNAYILYHVINYLVIFGYYATLVDNDENASKRKLVENIFGNIPQMSEFRDKITEKQKLLDASIEIKKDKLTGFYAYDKIKLLVKNIIEKVNTQNNDDGMSNHIVEYRNNLKIKKDNMYYGEYYMKKYSFTGFTNNVDPNNFYSTTPIMAADQLLPLKRNSIIIFPNYGLKNTDLFTVTKDKVPTEHHNYLTMSFVKSGFANSIFNVAFALLRIKFNFSYQNINGGLNITKTLYNVDENGEPINEITPSVSVTDPKDNKDNKDNQDDNVFHMPSELIDLGIAHYSDFNYKHLIHHLEEFENTLSCISINPDKQDFIIGYSLYYLGFDIYQMLWEQTTMPWADLKFAKRLDRFFMVILYDFVRNEIRKNRPQIEANIQQNYNSYITIRDDILKLLSDRDNNYAAINGNQQQYKDMLNEIIRKYFKLPELINVETLLKLNEQSFNYLLVAHDDFADIGILINTILHFIYNVYILEYFSPEQIYEFYMNSSIKNNFIITDDLKKYLGMDTNGTIIQRPRPDTDLDIIKDVNKYLRNYADSFNKWIEFFASIIESQINDVAQYNSLLNIVKRKIANLSGGSKTKKHNNKKTLKQYSNKKTLINKRKHKGGAPQPFSNTSGNTLPLQLTTNPSTTGISTRTNTKLNTNAITTEPKITTDPAITIIKNAHTNSTISTNSTNSSGLKQDTSSVSTSTSSAATDTAEAEASNLKVEKSGNMNILEDFRLVGVVYDDFTLFDKDVAKKYKTINLEGSFVNDLADIF